MSVTLTAVQPPSQNGNTDVVPQMAGTIGGICMAFMLCHTHATEMTEIWQMFYSTVCNQSD